MIKFNRPGWTGLAELGRWINVLLGGTSSRFRPLFDATHLTRLDGRLEVVRDRNGVAHLYANHENDLYVALGYLQGSERSLHLEALRALARGRLSEWIAGVKLPDALGFMSVFSLVDIDRFVRPLGFVDEARRDMAALSPRLKTLLTAYAQGVNDAWRAGLRSPEHCLLGRTNPWTPEDCLLAARACALVIALLPLENELVFDGVRADAGDALARLLYPDAPWEQMPELAAGGTMHGAEPPVDPLALGSNNWAVAGTRTASGKPLLANDPHVPLMPAPTFWHHVHLKCPHYDVEGGMYPGFPGFGFGHNAQLAWGVTTAFRDAWDVFRIERLAGAPGRYRTATGSGIITRHEEPLNPRFRRADTVVWERCEHGVIYPGWQHGDGADLALRYADCDHAAHFAGHVALMSAHTPEALDAALAQVNEGPFDFNVVHAHHEGRIGWNVVGRLPRRRRDGLFVRNAHDPDAQWDGYLSFTENPAVFDPPQGFVASANSVTDAAQHARLATAVHCEVNYRQRRIEAWLHGAQHSTVADMQAMQADVDSLFSRPLREALCDMLAPYQQATPLQRDALQALADWTGVFDINAVGASVFSWLRRLLPSIVFGRLLSEKMARRFAHGQRAIPRLDGLLLNAHDPLRPVILEKTGFDLAHWVGVAFERSVERLARQFGENVHRWRWGRVQQVKIASVLGDLLPGATPFVALETGFPGEANTLSPAVSMAQGAAGLRVVNGASSRFICDLAYPREAWFAHSSGPSCDPETPYFRSVSEQWAGFVWFRSALWAAEEVPEVIERVIVRASDLEEFHPTGAL